MRIPENTKMCANTAQGKEIINESNLKTNREVKDAQKAENEAQRPGGPHETAHHRGRAALQPCPELVEEPALSEVEKSRVTPPLFLTFVIPSRRDSGGEESAVEQDV